MLARTKKVQHKDVLQTTAVRDFDGGWNVIDNDLSMRVKYARRLDNLIRKDDGTLGVRWGTKVHVKLPIEGATLTPEGTVDGEWIINITYFQDFLVVVTSRGAIYAVDATGRYQEIWQVVAVEIGNWANDLTVNYGEVYTDTSDSSKWWSRRADGNVTSPAPTTFAEERAANPSWWGSMADEQYPLWDNKINYAIGNLVTDVDDDSDWYCEVAHTSRNGGTMAQDRADNPTYWTAVVEDGTRGWHATEFVSFAVFHDHLIAVNGVDKPVKINFLETVKPHCDWLVDEGTGSNGNTPVCKYVMAMNDFVFMAGDVQQPDLLYVSSTGTSGTWVGDPDPNDAVNIQIAKKISTNHPEIKGLARYRDKIIIAFDEKLAIGVPGTFINEGTDASPIMVHDLGVTDAIEAHGALAHRSMIYLGDDLFMLDAVGVPSVASTIFKDTLTPARPSELIDPELQRNIRELSQGVSENNIFAVYNLLEKEYMVFLPNHNANLHRLDDPALVIADFSRNYLYVHSYDHNVIERDVVLIEDATAFNTITEDDLNGMHTVLNIIDADYFVIQLPDTVVLDVSGAVQPPAASPITMKSIRSETLGYVLSHRKEGKQIKAWSRFRGWNWQCGCRSLLGTLFFCDYDTIYYYGNKQNELFSDFIAKDDVTNIGTPIDWEWETPWSSLSGNSAEHRMLTKKFRYIGFDTKGDAQFTTDMYIDQIFKDQYGDYDPTLQMDFWGSENSGYGGPGAAYGGGRRSQGERLYNWTSKAKLVKLRLHGSTTRPLRLISILLAYMRGSIRR